MRTGQFNFITVFGAVVASGCAADSKGDAASMTAAQETGDPAAESSSSGSGGSTGAVSGNGEASPVTTDDPGDSSNGDGPGFYFDVGSVPDMLIDPEACGAPPVVTCDDDDDPFHAIGLNCGGGYHVDGMVQGDPLAFYIHDGNLGTYEPAPYPPREGDKILVMSSGHAADIAVAGMYASNDVAGFVDNGADLPPPIVTNVVDLADTCADDPGLVGTGDCSNTIDEQWEQGNGANDYAEMRFTATVPNNTTGFSYDLAMFSTEYPVYYHSQFNDMYVAWLESENWTGNISFDEMGHPISLNAGFLDYKDAPNPIDCPAPCSAPELAGTAMEGHAGTKWLTTTAGVTPNEDILLIFAVFDLSDGILDTVVLIDNFHWGCEGGPPVTIPG
jgi:hypothetical protein